MRCAGASAADWAPEHALAPGLHLVATPIGNLEDLTFRAVKCLKEVILIACEDTRRTAKLLNHLGIKKPLISCFEHNEVARIDELLGKIAAGADLVQFYTGLIFKGPALPAQILNDLVGYLDRHRFPSIADAVGIDVDRWAAG